MTDPRHPSTLNTWRWPSTKPVPPTRTKSPSVASSSPSTAASSAVLTIVREMLKDPTAHAEMIAITQAAASLQSWRLENCILYVTLEPCPMCAGAIVLARLPMIVYGAADPKAGACDTLYQITNDPRLNHRSQVVAGVLAERCGEILSEFFAAKRKLGKG